MVDQYKFRTFEPTNKQITIKMNDLRELTVSEIKAFQSTKNYNDLRLFLSGFNSKVYRVETKNATTGEGFSKLYTSSLSVDEIANKLNVRFAWVDRVKA